MRVLIADDHDLVREAIAALLIQEGIEEVETVPDLERGIAMIEETGVFDLVLLDYLMPGMNGLEGLYKMLDVNRARPVALISANMSRSNVEEAIGSGAAGFIPKTMSSHSLANAVRFMASGEIYAPYTFMKTLNETVGDLSLRESEVLKGICQGKSNKEIARDLELQEPTIKLHVKTLCRKLNAKNRTHAAMLARDLSIL